MCLTYLQRTLAHFNVYIEVVVFKYFSKLRIHSKTLYDFKIKQTLGRPN